MSSPYQKAYFLLSVADTQQLPPDQGREVAIVGRSNAGKSSVLNCLTQQKHLARVSKTPGRTQLVNIFVFDDTHRMADLPGYGYAQATPAAKRQWQTTVDTYLRTRTCLQGLVVVMDIRHPLQILDKNMLAYAEQCALPVHILLNKADKISKHAAQQTLKTVQAQLQSYSNPLTLQIFSAHAGTGLPALRQVLNAWYGYN